MQTNKPLIVSAYEAEADFKKYRFASFGSADAKAANATVATKPCLGVTTNVKAETGDHVDIVIAGITPVEYGANVERGQAITCDAQSRAVPLATATTGAIAYGKALASGKAGDVGSILIAS